MVAPALTVRIDFANDGAFTGALDSCAGRVLDDALSFTRGRSADFSAEATGAASFSLDNFDDRYTPDRNWHDNPSFEDGTAGWSVAAIASLVAAATSISQVIDNAPSAGTKAGEAVLTATLNSGVSYPIPYRFRAGITYSVSVWLKSTLGNLNVRAGLASSGTPADIASSGANITASWAQYTFTWTPSADRTDGVFFVRTTTAATATVRIDAIGVNPGATANTYIEAPTRGQLVPGRPVHIYATFSAVDYPMFYGFIERLTPDPTDRTVAITCYDVLRRFAETDIVVPAHTYVQRSARDFRREALEDFERGDRNLLPNPSFETNLASWANDGGTLSRVTTDGFDGTACAELVAASANTRLFGYARSAPVSFAGVPYRFSLYARQTSGSGTWMIRLGNDAVSLFASKSITVDTTWRRFSIVYTPATSNGSGGALPLRGWIESIAAGTVRIDAAMLTRGPLLFDYSATGAAGRRPTFVGNGSFDGGALNGWKVGYRNLVGNPSFEVDTLGWSTAGDAFYGGAATLTRQTVDPNVGVGHGQLVTSAGAAAEGTHYAISGTFKAGVTYDIRATMKRTAGTRGYNLGIGSNGTPADTALTGLLTDAAYTVRTVTWTPSADRIDVHLYLKTDVTASATTILIDAVMVTKRDSSEIAAPGAYFNDGPNAGLEEPTSRTIGTTAKYGSKALEFVTPATAKAGMVYDFSHWEPYFVSGQPYTLSAWVRVASGTGSIKVGLAAAKPDGMIDEVSATNGAVGTTYVQITATWTPSADFLTGIKQVVLYVCQTDATARTIHVDGVRVIPGSADDFEMPQWALAQESDAYATTASLSGSALAALNQINGYALTRHWIEPTMASPWYQYTTSARDDLAAKTSQETFNDDLADMSAADIDRASIINVVPVQYSGGTEHYSDAASVVKYGPRPASAVGSGAFFSGLTIPDSVGPALVARYRDPRARPVIRIENRWPSQLQRELDDLITVTFARLRISNGRYLILRLETTVSEAAQRWTTVYALEEHGA